MLKLFTSKHQYAPGTAFDIYRQGTATLKVKNVTKLVLVLTKYVKLLEANISVVEITNTSGKPEVYVTFVGEHATTTRDALLKGIDETHCKAETD